MPRAAYAPSTMLRRLVASLSFLAGTVAIAATGCRTTRTGELEPRYVAVHNTLAAIGFSQVGPLQQGSLAEGREMRVRLELFAECTAVVVIGGAGVRDIDAALLDPDDKPLSRDTSKGPQATLRACPEKAGPYTLVVTMVAGAGDLMVATWLGGATGGLPLRASPATPLVEMGAGTCESPIALLPGVTTGNTRRGEAENAGRCASSDSRELVYTLAIERRQRVVFEVDPQFDSVLYVRKDGCGDGALEVVCNDDASSGPGQRGSASKGSRVDEVLDPGTYWVFVDGYGTESGTFRMNVQTADVPTLSDACKQVRPLGPNKLAASLAGAFDHAQASCGAEAKGPDALYRFDLPARARVRITEHSADFTPALHLRRQCTDEQSEVACANSGVKADEATFAGVLDPGSYVLFADSEDKDARGAYTLESELSPESGTGVQGDACADAVFLSSVSKAVEGDTFLARDDLASTCGGPGAPDVVYRFELARRSRVMAHFSSQESDHVFVMTRSCSDRSAELACGSSIDEVLAPGVYYVGVDGASAAGIGRFVFDFHARDVSSQENACRSPTTLVDGQTVSGTTAGAPDAFSTTCGGAVDAQASGDKIYKIVLGSRARVRLSLSTPSWDGVLSLRESCIDRTSVLTRGTAEVACNNDFQDARHARIETMLEPGTYWVLVDGHLAKNEGPYTLEYRVLK